MSCAQPGEGGLADKGNRERKGEKGNESSC